MTHDESTKPESEFNADDVCATAIGDEIATLVDLTTTDDVVRINPQERRNKFEVIDYYHDDAGRRQLVLRGNGTTYHTETDDDGVRITWPSGEEQIEWFRVENRNAWEIEHYDQLLGEEVEAGTGDWKVEWGHYDHDFDAEEAERAKHALAAMVADYRDRFDLSMDEWDQRFRDMLALHRKFEKWADGQGMTVHGHEKGLVGAALDYAREDPDIREHFERIKAEAEGDDEGEPVIMTDGGVDQTGRDQLDIETLEEWFEQGVSPAEAIDYFAVEKYGKSQTEWARVRGRSQPTVSENVEKATRRIESQPRPCTKCGETRPDSELSSIRSGNSKTDYQWEDYCHDCINDMS